MVSACAPRETRCAHDPSSVRISSPPSTGGIGWMASQRPGRARQVADAPPRAKSRPSNPGFRPASDETAGRAIPFRGRRVQSDRPAIQGDSVAGGELRAQRRHLAVDLQPGFANPALHFAARADARRRQQLLHPLACRRILGGCAFGETRACGPASPVGDAAASSAIVLRTARDQTLSARRRCSSAPGSSSSSACGSSSAAGIQRRSRGSRQHLRLGARAASIARANPRAP